MDRLPDQGLQDNHQAASSKQSSPNSSPFLLTRQNEGAEMAYFHQEPESQILILNPGTYRLFDAYCHPDWLSAGDRRHYDKAVEKEGEGYVEEWRRKVLLKEAWVSKCLLAGRFLVRTSSWRLGGGLTM
jgi:hypothetical protein